MASMNKVMIEGMVGKDAEMRYTQQGTAILSFSLAWNDYRDGKAGPTTWFKVNVWGKFGEALNGAITKGQKVLVVGRVELREWQKQDGTKGASLEVAAEEVKLLAQLPKRQQTVQQQPSAEGDVPW